MIIHLPAVIMCFIKRIRLTFVKIPTQSVMFQFWKVLLRIRPFMRLFKQVLNLISCLKCYISRSIKRQEFKLSSYVERIICGIAHIKRPHEEQKCIMSYNKTQRELYF